MGILCSSKPGAMPSSDAEYVSAIARREQVSLRWSLPSDCLGMPLAAKSLQNSIDMPGWELTASSSRYLFAAHQASLSISLYERLCSSITNLYSRYKSGARAKTEVPCTDVASDSTPPRCARASLSSLNIFWVNSNVLANVWCRNGWRCRTKYGRALRTDGPVPACTIARALVRETMHIRWLHFRMLLVSLRSHIMSSFGAVPKVVHTPLPAGAWTTLRLAGCLGRARSPRWWTPAAGLLGSAWP